jgi:hypothetical protein
MRRDQRLGMANGLVLAATMALLACPRTRSSALVVSELPLPSAPSLTDDECVEGAICRVFLRQGECPNWNEALRIARERACCGVNPERPNRGNRNCPCQRPAVCDLCLFLNDDRPPVTSFEDLSEYGRSEPIGPIELLLGHTKHLVKLRKSLCTGTSNVVDLAATMVHEADHLCHELTYEWNPDPFGRRDKLTDECHAVGVERLCGFKPKPTPYSTRCF